MINNRYVKGIAAPVFDGAVSRAIKRLPNDGGGNTMVTAIENAEGKVYRVIETVGLGAYMSLTSRLASLGLEDLYADKPGAGGFDSRFVVPSSMRQQQLQFATAAIEHSVVASPRPPPPPAPLVDPASEILAAGEELRALPETERHAIVLSRVGQGQFRQALVEYWGACAVTGAKCIDLLRASHIKPWRSSSNLERLDSFNGLLLLPNLDAAFDSGRITFDKHGRILISEQLQGQTAYDLHISPKMRIDQKRLTAQHQTYFDYHRREIFR